MNSINVIACAVSAILGVVLVGLRMGTRRLLREASERYTSSSDLLLMSLATSASRDRIVLDKIEAGDLSGAKDELHQILASFYQNWTKHKESSESSGLPTSSAFNYWIINELRAIEEAAARSEKLRTALAADLSPNMPPAK